jgi:hypothetical protein
VGGSRKDGKAYFTPLPITDAGLKIQGLRAYRSLWLNVASQSSCIRL